MKILKSHFWPEKFTNIGPEYTNRCRIEKFGRVYFLRKVDFVNYFMKNHDFGFLRLQWTSIVISKVLNHDFFMKILTKSTFVRKYTPPNVAIPDLLVYSGPILVHFSGQNWDYIFFIFPPL